VAVLCHDVLARSEGRRRRPRPDLARSEGRRRRPRPDAPRPPLSPLQAKADACGVCAKHPYASQRGKCSTIHALVDCLRRPEQTKARRRIPKGNPAACEVCKRHPRTEQLSRCGTQWALSACPRRPDPEYNAKIEILLEQCKSTRPMQGTRFALPGEQRKSFDAGHFVTDIAINWRPNENVVKNDKILTLAQIERLERGPPWLRAQIERWREGPCKVCAPHPSKLVRGHCGSQKNALAHCRRRDVPAPPRKRALATIAATLDSAPGRRRRRLSAPAAAVPPSPGE